MVLLGGLEIVAAGYVIHALNNDKDVKKRSPDRHSGRKHDKKHHHRRDSPPHGGRPQQGLYPPQGKPQRAHSAPPIQHQPPPGYYNQQWRPQQNNLAPGWQPQPHPQPHPQQHPPQHAQTWKQQQNLHPLQTVQAAQGPTPARLGHAAEYFNPNATFRTPTVEKVSLAQGLDSQQMQRHASQTGEYERRRPSYQTGQASSPDPRYAELSGDIPSYALIDRERERPRRHRRRRASSSSSESDSRTQVGERDPPPAYHV